jgi:hypothetical protein
MTTVEDLQFILRRYWWRFGRHVATPPLRSREGITTPRTCALEQWGNTFHVQIPMR